MEIKTLNTEDVALSLNEKEFHNIYDRYYVPLCMFARRYVEDNELSTDIVQETFATLWQKRNEFSYLHQIKGFLYTSVRNRALKELEHARVVGEYNDKMLKKSSEEFFHDRIVEEETYRILNEAIDKLPPQMKTIMKLSLNGKKNPEIAENMNISEETVHTLKKLSYKKLRVSLKDYYYLLLPFTL